MATVLSTRGYGGVDFKNWTFDSSNMTTAVNVWPKDTVTSSIESVLCNFVGRPINDRTLCEIEYTVSTAMKGFESTGLCLYGNDNITTNNTISIDATPTNNTISIYATPTNSVWVRYNVSTGRVSGWGNVWSSDTRPNVLRRLSPTVRVRGSSPLAKTPEEAIAQEALREVVSEREFRKYLRYGFVLVEGRSGARYQVFRNSHHVKVWVGGKLVEEVCVYLSSVLGKTAPPTDKVVAFKAMIEADEEAFKNMGNRYRNLAVAA